MGDKEKSNSKSESKKIILYRIIGNDLVPRHKKGQARENLEFILAHENEFMECEKRFVVNRIVDEQEREKVIELLELYGAEYVCIPFSHDEYSNAEFDIGGVPKKYLPFGVDFKKLSAAQ